MQSQFSMILWLIIVFLTDPSAEEKRPADEGISGFSGSWGQCTYHQWFLWCGRGCRR